MCGCWMGHGTWETGTKEKRVEIGRLFTYLTWIRSGKAEFAERRIPGAAFFDLEEVCDKNSSLPHMVIQSSHTD